MTLNLRKISASALVLLSATVLLPQAASALDEKQKQEMGEFIREYLVANPEILLEAQQSLKKKQADEQLQLAQSAIKDNEQAIFQSKYDVTLGNPNGDVTIVEFYDYNCGYCKRALSDMDAILDSDKNVRFVLKELPILGPDSLAAHKVSAAFRDIAPDKFADFHRALLGGEDRATEETAMAVASGLGVAEADLRRKMTEDSSDEGVKEAYTLANSLGITGTPSYIIGQEAVFGAVGAEELAEKVSNVRTCGKTVC